MALCRSSGLRQHCLASLEIRFGILLIRLLVGFLGSIRLVDLRHCRFQDRATLQYSEKRQRMDSSTMQGVQQR